MSRQGLGHKLRDAAGDLLLIRAKAVVGAGDLRKLNWLPHTVQGQKGAHEGLFGAADLLNQSPRNTTRIHIFLVAPYGIAPCRSLAVRPVARSPRGRDDPAAQRLTSRARRPRALGRSPRAFVARAALALSAEWLHGFERMKIKSNKSPASLRLASAPRCP